MKYRTFGWVQNPSDFENLRLTVQIFDNNSLHHANLKELINKFVLNPNKKEELLSAILRKPLKLSYTELVGTGSYPRSEALCDALVQVSIKDQGNKKGYIDNWSSDGFIRWALCLGFIEYHYKNDSFSITDSGLKFSKADYIFIEDLLIQAMLSYPPVTRVLSLLSDCQIWTKFEIGSKLGFTGENGFTSLPEDILIDYLHDTENTKEKNSIRSDWEGTSDKYARMISKWLVKLKMVKQEQKSFYFPDGNEFITHSYRITGKGLKIYNSSLGKSKHSKINKKVCWEMFATKGKNREYIRTRRSLILQHLMLSNSPVKLHSIYDNLKIKGFQDSFETIINDINGLINCGINIESTNENYKLIDNIDFFVIPNIAITEELKDAELQNKKETLLVNLKFIDPSYIELIEIAFDPKQNRFFEFKVMELFKHEYGFNAKWLGGGRRPDGVIFYKNNISTYGVIIDTKAYSEGYSLPINQADEMQRYVEENNRRDLNINSNNWWSFFPSEIKKFYFLFISSKFIGKYNDKLNNIALRTGISGGAINIESLLYGANQVKNKKMELNEIQNYFINEEIKF